MSPVRMYLYEIPAYRSRGPRVMAHMGYEEFLFRSRSRTDNSKTNYVGYEISIDFQSSDFLLDFLAARINQYRQE